VALTQKNQQNIAFKRAVLCGKHPKCFHKSRIQHFQALTALKMATALGIGNKRRANRDKHLKFM
jgi:hypothetical protein